MDEEYYPVPWSVLQYDVELGGYRTNLDKDTVTNAPGFIASTAWNWDRT